MLKVCVWFNLILDCHNIKLDCMNKDKIVLSCLGDILLIQLDESVRGHPLLNHLRVCDSNQYDVAMERIVTILESYHAIRRHPDGYVSIRDLVSKTEAHNSFYGNQQVQTSSPETLKMFNSFFLSLSINNQVNILRFIKHYVNSEAFTYGAVLRVKITETFMGLDYKVNPPF